MRKRGSGTHQSLRARTAQLGRRGQRDGRATVISASAPPLFAGLNALSPLFLLSPVSVLTETYLEEHQEHSSCEPDREQHDREELTNQPVDQYSARRPGED